jgi:type IV secretory pathway protease TraF
MYPILKNGQFVVFDKYIHKLFTIQRNDILLFKIENKEMVKKIVGFPSESISVEGKNISLGSNEIYALGENLEESIDSRELGPLKTSQIIGKIFLVF